MKVDCFERGGQTASLFMCSNGSSTKYKSFVQIGMIR